MVGASIGLGIRSTGLVLRTIGFALTFFVHGIVGWSRLMAGKEGEDTAMVLRRRKWLVLMLVSVFPAVGALFAPGLLSTVGVLPLGVVCVPLLVLSIVRTRRLSRGHRTAGQMSTPAMSAPSALDTGDWSDTNPRTQAAERAIGDALWKMGESGVSVEQAIGIVAGMPPFSQTVWLWVAEATLARFSVEGGKGELNDPAMVARMLWFFDFTHRLRGWLGGGPMLAVAEPGMRQR